jgi:hypothetical protein
MDMFERAEPEIIDWGNLSAEAIESTARQEKDMIIGS